MSTAIAAFSSALMLMSLTVRAQECSCSGSQVVCDNQGLTAVPFQCLSSIAAYVFVMYCLDHFAAYFIKVASKLSFFTQKMKHNVMESRFV